MAMRSDTKRILTVTAASVVAVILTLLCVKQCNGKKTAIAERDAARKEAANNSVIAGKNTIALEEALDSLIAARRAADSLAGENRVLTDSLIVVNKKLEDCENCKPCARRSSNNASRTTRPSRASTSRTSTTVTTRSSGTSTTTSVATRTDNSATVTTSEKPSATAVTIGSGAHDNVVTVNNGTVNNFYAPVDTVKTQCASATQTVVITRRVRTR